MGQAELSVASDGLHVTNIGSPGNDGVRLVLPDGVDPRNIDTTIFGSGLGTPSSPNGTFQQTVRGNINDSPEQPIYLFSATPMSGGGVNLFADMSPVAPSSLTVFYYNQRALVHTETGIVNGADVACGRVPDDFGGGSFTWILIGTVLTPDGNMIATDDVVVEPVGSTVPFSGPFSTDYTASQIGGFVIGEVASVPEVSSIALLSFGLAGMALLRRRT